MKANGAVVGLIDVPQEHTQDYNVWYDFDHLPEFVALDDMLLGRRYVADTECKAARPGPSKLPELADGKGSYCSTYFMSTTDIGAVMGYWNQAGVRLRKEKRIFRHGKIADVTFYALTQAHARPGIPVVEAAVPYLGHQGIYVVMTEVADPAMRPAVDEWFAEAHSKDLLAVPGVVAAMRLEAPRRVRHGRRQGRPLHEPLPARRRPGEDRRGDSEGPRGLGRARHVACPRRRLQRPVPEPLPARYPHPVRLPHRVIPQRPFQESPI